MKKVLVNYGGIVFFYLVVILGMVFLNLRAEYVNNRKNTSFQNDIAYID